MKSRGLPASSRFSICHWFRRRGRLMRLQLDKEADAAYIVIADRDVSRTEKLDENRLMDYGERNTVVGIEFLNVSSGVDLSDLPFHDELVRLFNEQHVKQSA